MKKIHNIGILYFFPRHGGGTFQFTENVMCVLSDYAETQRAVRAHLFFSKTQAEELVEIKSRFPNFIFHRISKITWMYYVLLRRIFFIVPLAVSILRYFYPLNWIARKHNIDLMVFPGITADASFYWGRQITLFTDIAHIFYPHFPEVSEGDKLRQRNVLFKYGIKNASQIVVESNQLRLDIAKFYQANISKVDVLYQTMSQAVCVNDNDEECVDFINTLPEKYLFYPAQLWEHKNHKNLLWALKLLVAKDYELCLILSGSRKKGDEQIFSLIDELNLQDHVKYLGYVSDKFMPILYKNAQMLVMPTYFGPSNIPTLEAFYFGCPAVISDLPGVREQSGNAALLFNPDSSEDIADKIQFVLYDKDRQEKMVKMGYERMKLLSYENYRDSLFSIIDKNLKDSLCKSSSVSIDATL